MDRRAFIGVIGAEIAIGPLRAKAQQASTPRIGVLSPFTPSDAPPWHEAFRQGLRELGWIEGKNIGIEYRYAESPADLPVLAAELVRLKVDVIVTSATGTLLHDDVGRVVSNGAFAGQLQSLQFDARLI
jgi:putative ABC transport system substrate-binding protein